MALSVDAARSFAGRWWFAALALLLALATSDRAEASTRRIALGDNRWVALDERHGLWLEALPRRGEGLLALARRLTGDGGNAKQLAKLNGRDGLLAGVRAKVPFELVAPELQAKALRALFAKDRPEPGAWVHHVVGLGAGKRESLWQVAHWFTGRGENHAALRQSNRLRDDQLRAGQLVRIPVELLRPALRTEVPVEQAAAPAPPVTVAPKVGTVEASLAPVTVEHAPSAKDPSVPALPETAAPAASGRGAEGPLATASVAERPAVAVDATGVVGATGRLAAGGEVVRAAVPSVMAPLAVLSAPASATSWRLSYGRDEQGEFALYRLQPGEALYSSVVVRFTGRIHAEDVNALAIEIARRSGIVDVTDIPIGFAVKVPLDVLQPEFLPSSHPRRREYEATLAVTEELADPPTAVGLEGVTVILDAGHGGRDSGASVGGVWESLYAYDIALRIKRDLERYTAASVVTTTTDDSGFAIPDRDVLGFSRSHRVMTAPPYAIEDSTISAHLRWYLANSVFRQAVKLHADPEKVVFVSVHADSLHPSLRGAMIYIPGAEGRGGSFGKSGTVFASRREFKEQPTVRFAKQELLASEGLSRDLARHLIDALRRLDLAVHPFKPVRETVIRNRRQWVPAVLRYNQVPAALLLEVCNLANAEDRRLIQTRAFRQEMAESVVSGLLSYFGYVPDLARPQLEAAAARR